MEAESLRPCGIVECEFYRIHKDNAAEILSRLKGFIVLERQRAKDLQEMQSLDKEGSNVA